MCEMADGLVAHDDQSFVWVAIAQCKAVCGAGYYATVNGSCGTDAYPYPNCSSCGNNFTSGVGSYQQGDCSCMDGHYLHGDECVAVGGLCPRDVSGSIVGVLTLTRLCGCGGGMLRVLLTEAVCACSATRRVELGSTRIRRARAVRTGCVSRYEVGVSLWGFDVWGGGMKAGVGLLVGD